MTTTITLQAAEMKRAWDYLKHLAPTLTETKRLPVLGHLVFQTTAQGQVSLSLRRLEEQLTVNIDPETKACGPATLFTFPVKELERLVKSKAPMAFTFDPAPETETQVVVHSWVYGTPTEETVSTLPPAAALPELEHVFDMQPAAVGELLQGLRVTAPFCSDDPTRYILNGIHLDSNVGYLVATDGKRLRTQAVTNKVSSIGACIIPATTFLASKHPTPTPGEELAGVAVAAPWLRLQTPEYTYSVKLLEGTYPNWQRIIPTDLYDFTKLEISKELAKKLISLCEKAPKSALEGLDCAICLEFKDDASVTLGTETFQATLWQNAPLRHKDKKVWLNREYFQTLLALGEQTMYVHRWNKAVVFDSPTNLGLLMPLQQH
jgi:hypothetical protein